MWEGSGNNVFGIIHVDTVSSPASLTLEAYDRNGVLVSGSRFVLTEFQINPSGAGGNGRADNEPLTMWRHDPSNVDYPVWDIGKILQQNGGELKLDELSGPDGSSPPTPFWTLSSDRKLGDITRDGKVNLNDYLLVEQMHGFVGVTDVDVGGAAGLGLPDGVVDGWDLYHLYMKLGPEDAGQVVAPEMPQTVEGFENGFDEFDWNFEGDSSWEIAFGTAHSGTHSAKSGEIADDQASRLTIRLDCIDGRIVFWRKVSSEENWDWYRFSINSEIVEELSGEIDWEQVSFPVGQGNNTFTWEYSKDGSSSSGNDAVFIDDVAFPVR
jgi:hypothetical protein